MTRLTPTIALCAALLLVPQIGAAQGRNPSQMAAMHSSNGGMAMASRDIDKALAEYVLAYAYDASPDRLVNVARAYEALGVRAVAAELYEQVIAVAKSGPAVDQARSRLAVLGGSTPPPAASGTPLTLTVMPPGAEVWVDGALQGRSPLPPLQLAAGLHRVEVRNPGYQTWTEDIQVTPGVAVSRVVTLMPGGSAPPPVEPPPGLLTLQITDIPAGATVTLNNQPVPVQGTTASATVAPGQYTLLVQHPSHPNFVRVLSVVAGQPVAPVQVQMGAVAPPVSPGPGAAATSLAGAWHAFELESKVDRATVETISLTLTGEGNALRGTMISKGEAQLPGWKQKTCGAESARWENRFDVRLQSAPGGMRILASGGVMTSCSCKGMCSSSSSKEIPVFVSEDNQVMVSEDLVFVRKTGEVTPDKALMDSVDMDRLTGGWVVHVGSVSQARRAVAQLSGRGASVAGELTLATSTELPRWRQKECGGDTHLKATHHFAVTAKADGGWIDVSFKHNKVSDCKCEASACAAAAQQERIGSERVRMTVSGNHLVGPGMLLTRK